MNPTIAAAIYAVGILGLFWLNYDPKVRTSKAVWIPVIWMLIVGSRAPSTWFQQPAEDNAAMYLEGNPFERRLFSVLLFAALVVVLARGPKILKALRGNSPLLLFIGYCAVSLLWSDYPSVGFRRWTKLVGDLAMVLIVVTDMDPSAAFDRLISRVGFLILPISVLFDRYYPDLGRAYDRWTGTVHWTGVTQNKNSLGMICMIIGLGELWRVIREFRMGKSERRTKILIAHAVTLAFAVYLLHAADSATSTVCFLLAGSLMVVMSLFPVARKPAVTHLLTIGFVWLAACAAFFDLAGLVQYVGRNPDLTGRTIVWSAALSQPVSRIFGSGYESFWVGDRLVAAQNVTGVFLNQAHDGYLEILINLGWIGVSLLGLLVVTGYWRVTRVIRWDSRTDYRRLAFFVAALIYNFTEAAFKMTVPVWICFVWAIVSAPRGSELGYSEVVGVDAAEIFSHDELRTSPGLARGLSPLKGSKPLASYGRRPALSNSRYHTDEVSKLR